MAGFFYLPGMAKAKEKGADKLVDKLKISGDFEDVIGVSAAVSQFNKMDIPQLREKLYFFHEQFITALKRGNHIQMIRSDAAISDILAVMDKLLGVHER